MEKYIRSIEDLVVLEKTNGILKRDESSSNFLSGLVNLLGIYTPVDIRRAKQFFCNPSLTNDPDANCILGFIDECEGIFSSSFKHYAIAAEKTGGKQFLSYFQKVIDGRNRLQKTFKQYYLSLTFNEEISRLLNDINNGNSKTKLIAKVIAAYVCEDEAACIEVAQELFDMGDYYSSKILLQKGKVDNSYPLYNRIDMQALSSKDAIMSCEGTIVELEGESILPDYERSLSIANIKKKCEDCSKDCCREWMTANKSLITIMIDRHGGQNKKIEGNGCLFVFLAVAYIFIAVFL